ncbi:permease-like cell division protein FtsX [Dasania sp. GY-MA-18]|uniref:Cell division protein FtsX n=1 Tax=Dasania phycosphaerae TaxID=2950436 RepID=A0A9J6RKH0_9GAMM|nr:MULTISPECIES: permease-like cell division protein FtsX [Dasania]MCR8922049.1 permease-like cell division protein FtsX [Dasania sp. GY-MA-18]MCZ0864477.1 permease-like cell division protein FtsX [Dasania phycosphaerae]MCZ0868205.1 permease-like cell division protein FtsX [Dasania phycosphaerae]
MTKPAQNSNQYARRKDKGASQSRVSLGDKLGSYASHHKLIAKDSFLRLLKTPIPSLMTWLVIGIALALPGGLFVALANVESVSKGWDGAAQVSLYLHKAVGEQDSRKLADKIRLRDDVAEVEYISAVQALEEFKKLSGYGDVLNQLDSNPLPAVIVVRPVDDSHANTQVLFEALQAIPQVEQAVIDLEWVQRLYSMMALGKRMTLALAALLSLGVLLVIGNTIRLAIESRRDEIVIVKLVGATNAFVRRPFLYTGLWYGLGGGIMAWLIISISVLWLSKPVAVLAGLYQSEFSLQGLAAGEVLMLWLAAGLLGLLGAWLAVGRHLGSIEPR